jgi:CBS domain containing-hemolysin-like protein
VLEQVLSGKRSVLRGAGPRMRTGSGAEIDTRPVMILLLLFVALALCVSFVFSILESVLLSITPAHVSLLEQEKHPSSSSLRRMKADIDRPLAAILSLNTIANTVGATSAGAQAAKVFGSTWLGVFSAVFTFLVLTLAEIIPKTLGAVHWKRLTPLVARVLRVLMVVMLPLVKLAQWMTRMLTPADRGPTVSRAELAALADAGTREGVVEEGESRVLKNVLRLARLSAADVMTPVDAMVALPGDLPVGSALQRVSVVGFSRLPLSAEGDEHCRRYVLRDDVLELAARDEHGARLCDVARELLAVPAAMAVPALFDEMAERREHIVVREDNGVIAGIVTMEDIIETLLGMDILDESGESALQCAARKEWQKRSSRRSRR